MNPTDLAVLAVMLLSAILAFARGFIRETLSIGGWVGAIILALAFYKPASVFLEPYIHSEIVRQAAAGLGILIVALVILSFFTHWVAGAVRGSALSAVDRSLGVLFGLARGAVLVSLVYLLGTMLFPEKEHPDWIAQARTRPLLQEGAGILANLIPDSLRAHSENEIERARRLMQQKADTDALLNNISNARPAADKSDDTGYKADDANELDKLLGTSEPKTPQQ